MQSYRLVWTQDGERKESAVTFSAAAAETYRGFYAARLDTEIEIVPVKPRE